MRGLRFLWTLAITACCLGGLWLLFSHPATPVPREWNPLIRLYVSDPVSGLTWLKLEAAESDPVLCREVLAEAGIGFRALPDLVDGPQCGIANRVELSKVTQASLAPVETSCPIALRLVMWERHGLQPASRELLGTELSRIEHFSSYSCRAMRLPGGASRGLSTHATAEAIDISGFRLANGQQISLLRDWDGETSRAAFLRAAQQSACDWFVTALGPDYNSLHADHFHLQSTGWGTCR